MPKLTITIFGFRAENQPTREFTFDLADTDNTRAIGCDAQACLLAASTMLDLVFDADNNPSYAESLTGRDCRRFSAGDMITLEFPHKIPVYAVCQSFGTAVYAGSNGVSIKAALEAAGDFNARGQIANLRDSFCDMVLAKLKDNVGAFKATLLNVAVRSILASELAKALHPGAFTREEVVPA